jgi:hypothetical protein
VKKNDACNCMRVYVSMNSFSHELVELPAHANSSNTSGRAHDACERTNEREERGNMMVGLLESFLLVEVSVPTRI